MKFYQFFKRAKILISLAIFFIYSSIFSQNNKKNTFKLMGTINATEGKIRLKSICDTMTYPKDLRNLQTIVEDGKFEISGNIEYPTGFYLRFEDGKNNFEAKGIIILDVGKQFITCDIKKKEWTNLDNASQKEYEDKFKPSFIQVETENQKLKFFDDSVKKSNQRKMPLELEIIYQNKRKNMYRLADKLLFDYVKKYPDSFVSFWKLAEQMHWGHETIYDSTFSNLSEKIKKTYSGKALFQKMQSSFLLQVGKKFPTINLVQHKETTIKFLDTLNLKTFTLIDFWYSHCSPCIKQFPKFKNIYANFNEKGFEIIGISIDKKEDIQDWENIISKQELMWNQFLDINGVESTRLSINVFPTNFLIDEKGVVIKKDISPEELSLFLKQNLKL